MCDCKFTNYADQNVDTDGDSYACPICQNKCGNVRRAS